MACKLLSKTTNFKYEKTNLELGFYFVIWISAVFYAIYSFAKSADLFFQSYEDEYKDFNEGWSFLNRKRDKSDNEYEYILHIFASIWPYIILGLFFTELQIKYYRNVIVMQLFQILFCTGVIISNLGLSIFSIFLAQPVLFTVIFYIFRNQMSLYIWSILSLFNMGFFSKLLLHNGYEHSEVSIIVVCLAWLNLKCTSFYMEYKDVSAKSVINLFAYSFYLPMFFTGPFIFYQQYENIVKFTTYPPLKDRLWNLLKNHIRILFWLFFTHLSLHFVYVGAIQYHPQILYSFNSWSLYGYGYLMGQFFHLKYIAYYGLGTALAKFQNVEVPNLPRCIGRIHLYSEMWKYFDVGLYKFLIRYIYIPTLHSKSVFNKMISSGLTFTFVWIWHGTTSTIFMWAFLNYVAVMLEVLGSEFYKCDIIQNLEKIVGQYWMKKIKCLCTANLMILCCISNFYYFAGSLVAKVFIVRVLEDPVQNTMILIFAFYTLSEVSSAVRKLPAAIM